MRASASVQARRPAAVRMTTHRGAYASVTARVSSALEAARSPGSPAVACRSGPSRPPARDAPCREPSGVDCGSDSWDSVTRGWIPSHGPASVSGCPISVCAT